MSSRRRSFPQSFGQTLQAVSIDSSASTRCSSLFSAKSVRYFGSIVALHAPFLVVFHRHILRGDLAGEFPSEIHLLVDGGGRHPRLSQHKQAPVKEKHYPHHPDRYRNPAI